MPHAPFVDGDYEVIMSTIKLLDDIVPDIHRAEACGVDCAERKQRIKALRDRLETIRVSYFPERIA